MAGFLPITSFTKEKLSATGLSVSEIAYKLRFEHSPSFSKLFKTKTNLLPLEFRRPATNLYFSPCELLIYNSLSSVLTDSRSPRQIEYQKQIRA